MAKARADAIERACEKSLQDGVGGVAVYDDLVLIDPIVPYGEIHYHKHVNAQGDLYDLP